MLLVQAPADATVPPMLRRCPDRSRASTRVAPLLLLFTLGCDRSPQRAPAEPLSAGSDDVSGRDVSGRPGAPPAERAPQDASAAAQDRDVAAPNVECPPWTELGPYLAVRFEGQARTWLAVDGVPICTARTPEDPDVVLFPSAALAANDQDGDGIPDAIDVLHGAEREAQQGHRAAPEDRANDSRHSHGTPGDITWLTRVLRGAGLEVPRGEDSRRAQGPPPQQAAPPTSGELLSHLEERFGSLPTDPRDTAHPFLPGDLVFSSASKDDTAPRFVGVVSNRAGEHGLPLLLRGDADGAVRETDALRTEHVLRRVRVARELTNAPPDHAGLAGLLARRRVEVPPEARQLLLVTVPLWNSSGGELRRFRRSGPSERWDEVGAPLPVRIGGAGLGRGLGLHDGDACSGAPEKREGDKRAPAGVFGLGTAFGRARQAPYAPGPWPYRATNAADRFVDDPRSIHYNTWQVEMPGKPRAWSSAEHLTVYSLGLVVEHNMPAPSPDGSAADTAPTRPVPGAGSAIFVHPWKAPQVPTVGCTALDERELTELLRWLDPAAQPVLVQVAGAFLAPR